MTDISKTLEERGSRYGTFLLHATIAQGLQDVMRTAPNWSKLDPDMRQALTVFSDKIARILNGDPYYADNWHDMSGYATLVERRILKMSENPIQDINTGKEWGAPYDKAGDPNYDVGNYRG